jgi:hypothetical protein
MSRGQRAWGKAHRAWGKAHRAWAMGHRARRIGQKLKDERIEGHKGRGKKLLIFFIKSTECLNFSQFSHFPNLVIFIYPIPALILLNNQ